MIHTLEQLNKELQLDGTSRDFLRQYYLQRRQTSDRFMLMGEGRLYDIFPADNSHRIVLQNVILKEYDDTRLFDEVPAICVVDHLNDYIGDECLERYDFSNRKGQWVHFICQMKVYMRSNNTLDVGIKIMMPHISVSVLPTLEERIKQWKTHLIYRGIHQSKPLYDDVKNMVRLLKRSPAHPYMIPSKNTSKEIQHRFKEVFKEMEYIKRVIHQPLVQKLKDDRLILSSLTCD